MTTTKKKSKEKKEWPYSCVAYANDQFDVYWSSSSQCAMPFFVIDSKCLFCFFFFLFLHTIPWVGIHFYAERILRDAILISMHITSRPVRPQATDQTAKSSKKKMVSRRCIVYTKWVTAFVAIAISIAEWPNGAPCWRYGALGNPFARLENGPKMTIKMNKQKQTEKNNKNNNENERKKKKKRERQRGNDEMMNKNRIRRNFIYYIPCVWISHQRVRRFPLTTIQSQTKKKRKKRKREWEREKQRKVREEWVEGKRNATTTRRVE